MKNFNSDVIWRIRGLELLGLPQLMILMIVSFLIHSEEMNEEGPSQPRKRSRKGKAFKRVRQEHLASMVESPEEYMGHNSDEPVREELPQETSVPQPMEKTPGI